jgi:hypothetical protein
MRLQRNLAATVANSRDRLAKAALTHLLYTVFLSTLLAISARALDTTSLSPYLRGGSLALMQRDC